MTLSTALTLYGIGFVAAAFFAFKVIASEPTAHGQGILAPIGCLAAIFWPVALIYLCIAAVCAWVAWAWSVVIRRGRP